MNQNTARTANASAKKPSTIAVIGFEDDEEAIKDIYKRVVAEFAFVIGNIESECSRIFGHVGRSYLPSSHLQRTSMQSLKRPSRSPRSMTLTS